MREDTLKSTLSYIWKGNTTDYVTVQYENSGIKKGALKIITMTENFSTSGKGINGINCSGNLMLDLVNSGSK